MSLRRDLTQSCDKSPFTNRNVKKVKKKKKNLSVYEIRMPPAATKSCINNIHHLNALTGAACQQRTLIPPDTWSCLTLGLASVLMLRPISPELVLFPVFWLSNIPRYFCFLLKIYKWGEVILLFNVIINDISVIHVTAHRCAGGLKKKFVLTCGS